MKELTKGKPIKVILMFSIPILIGQIFQLLYSLVDTRIVGQFLGEEALASVGATATVSDLLVSFVAGVTTGFSLVTAFFFGGKDDKGLKKAIGGTVGLGIVISLLLTVVCLIFIDPILRFLHIEENIVANSKAYVSVIIGGLIVTALYNIMAATLRAVGNSVTPLIFLMISTVSNVFLDIFFVAKLELGVAGAAYATVLAQMISVVLCFIYVLIKYPELFKNPAELIPDGKLIVRLLTNGMSMGFMSSFVCIGTVCIQTQINTFGTDTIISHTASRRIMSLFFMPGFVCASALATFCGQNLGAGHWSRIKEGIRDAVLVNWGINIISMLIVYGLGKYMIRFLVVTDNPEIISTSMHYMRFNIVFFPIVVMVVEFRNAMQGFGDTRTPIISSLLELLVKVLIAIFLAPVIGYEAIVICEPVAWFIMLVPLAWGMYRRGVFSRKDGDEIPTKLI